MKKEDDRTKQALERYTAVAPAAKSGMSREEASEAWTEIREMRARNVSSGAPDVLRLSKAYLPARVDAGCARALMATAFNYRSVKAILEKGLDAVAFGEPANNSPVVHENFRGAAYYSNQELMKMLTQQTIDSLRALRLPAMAQAYAEQMVGPKAANLSFDQRLGMIVDREIATRANKRLARLIREARPRLNAVITGPTGVGKSFIARALGNLACRLTLNTGS